MVICKGGTGHPRCPVGQIIRVYHVYFGTSGAEKFCPTDSQSEEPRVLSVSPIEECDGTAAARSFVYSACTDKVSCTVSVETFGEFCPGRVSHFYMEFQCVTFPRQGKSQNFLHT